MTGRVLPPLSAAVGAILLWWLVAVVGGIPESSLPGPGAVAGALWAERALLAEAAAITAAEILLGFALALVAGVALAVPLASSQVASRAFYPWLVASQMVPIPAIAPIVVIWFGFGVLPKVLLIALVSVLPIVVSTADGLRRTDPELIDLLRSMGAGRRQQLLVARAPSALPALFSGMKVAAALAAIGAVFAEWAGSSDGLGYLILTFGNQTRTPELFAAIAVLAVLGIALFGLVRIAERLATPWQSR